MKLISNINEIENNFSAFIIDIWGVIWDGLELYKNAKSTLEKLKENNKNVILLSNAPRRSKTVKDRLYRLGISDKLYSDVISSGEVCRELFLKNTREIDKLGKDYYFIGQSDDRNILEKLPLKEQIDIKNSNFLIVCGTRDFDHNLNYYIEELNEGLALNLPLICANPDKIVVRKNGDILTCAGAFADYYLSKGGKVKYFGKPYKEVYLECIKNFKKLNPDLNKKQILVIGDSFETDILGANEFKVKSVLIAEGIHKRDIFTKSNEFSLQNVSKLSKKYKATPDYLINKFIF